MAKVPITDDILELVRGYAHKKDISLSEFGRRADISKAWLSKLKNTDANLSLETATHLLHTIGYDLKIVKGKSPDNDDNNENTKTESKKIENTKTESKTTSRLKRVVECQNI